MMTNTLARFVALGVGGLLIVQAINGAAGSFSKLDDFEAWRIWSLVLPVVLALAIAICLYWYAARLRIPEDANIDRSILWVGLKLLGAYLVISGLPAAIATFGYLALDSLAEKEMAPAIMSYLGMVALLETILGFMLLFGTRLLVKLLMRDDDR